MNEEPKNTKEDAVEQVVRDAEKSALEPLCDKEKDDIRKEAMRQLAERLAENQPRMPLGRRKPFGWTKSQKCARKRARRARRCTRRGR